MGRYTVQPLESMDDAPLELDSIAQVDPALAKTIVANMARMKEIAESTEEQSKPGVRAEYVRLAKEVIDKTSEYLRSAHCPLSAERKERLLAHGDALREEGDQLDRLAQRIAQQEDE